MVVEAEHGFEKVRTCVNTEWLGWLGQRLDIELLVRLEVYRVEMKIHLV